MTSTKAPQARSKTGYLGKITESASQRRAGDDRIAKFLLQSAARELYPAGRIRVCMRGVVPGRDDVEVWHSLARKRAYYQGLMRCNMVWVCPVCASKITERRRVELARLLSVRDELIVLDKGGCPRTISAPRYYLSLATFTLAHCKGEALRDVLARLKLAYRRVWSGRWAVAWKKLHRVVGMIRAIEPTYGEHGWHPHIHLLLIRDSANTQGSIAAMDLDLTLRWAEMVAAGGGEASLTHGVCFSGDEGKAADYPNKMGQQVEAAIRRWDVVSELTKYPVKKGRVKSRTMWDLLADYVGGDVHAGELWIEGVGAMRGTAHLYAERGLWKALGASDRSMSDEILAGEDMRASDTVLARLSLDDWRLVVAKSRRGELLEIASAGDPVLVDRFIEELRTTG